VLVSRLKGYGNREIDVRAAERDERQRVTTSGRSRTAEGDQVTRSAECRGSGGARIVFEALQLRFGHRPRGGNEAIGDVVAVDVPRGGIRLLHRSSILYLQARGDYVRIVSDEGRFLLRGRISGFETSWAPFGFIRVHRSYVVNLRRAVEVRPQANGTATLLFASGEEVPVARRKQVELRRILGASVG